MATKKGKTIEEELIDKSGYITVEAIDSEALSKYEQFEKGSGSRMIGLQEEMQQEVEKLGLDLNGTVYFLMGSQLLVSFVLLLVLDLLKVILSLILMLVIFGVLFVYCGVYCLIVRHPKKFQSRSSAFVCWTVLAVCEGLVLCFLSIPISTEVFLLVVCLVICGWFVGSLAAKVKKEGFNERMALSCVIGSSLLMYVIWMVCFKKYLWLTLCSVAALVYEFFMIKQISQVITRVNKEELQETFTAGVYVCILLFKSKIDLFMNILYWVYQKTCKQPESSEPESTNN